jgi:hypothetical protein
MIFQRYRLPSSNNPVPSSLNPPDPYHTFNTPPPCLSFRVPRSNILATAVVLDTSTYSPSPVLLFTINCYDYGYGTSLRLNERRHGIPPFCYCTSRKAPFPYFHTFSHARCTPSKDFAAAALRPRQVFTNILHLQYHSQYMACPILSQPDFGTSAFVLAASEKRPS